VRRLALSLLGVGTLPGPSGTYASLVTAGAIALAALDGASPVVAGAFAAVLGTVATLAFAGRATAAGGDADPSWIVSDEVAGQGLAALGAYAVPGSAWAPLATSFVLFRVLDVVKPGPVGACERLPGAWGVLADDLAAGALAGGVVAGAAALGFFALPVASW
jgi:phosphatidylglycerophosphatase A